jgi:hypothetical protein
MIPDSFNRLIRLCIVEDANPQFLRDLCGTCPAIFAEVIKNRAIEIAHHCMVVRHTW